MSQPVNANQLLDMDTPDVRLVWGPVITLGSLVMVFGPTGSGKSRLSMALAYIISAGGRFLNHSIEEPRKVLYIDTELEFPALKRRVLEIRGWAPFSPRGDHMRFFTRAQCGPRMWNLSNPIDQRKYLDIIGDSEVVFIDNILGCVYPTHSRDDDVSQWNRIIPWLHNLRASGKTIILLHHTGKSGQQLGTSIKEAWLDTNIELRIPQPLRLVRGLELELHYRKTRDVLRSDAAPMHVEYVQDTDSGVSRWYWKPLESAQQNTINDLKSKGMGKREVARVLGLSFREVELNWEDSEVNI
jgi:RecA-family ATPase